MAEEVYLDKDDRFIATGCEGTREGLRGQPNRCNLKELCEHLWAETAGDPKPDPDNTKWQKVATDLSKFDVTKGVGAITSVSWKGQTGKAARLNPGYTGFTNVGNLVAGATDYYKVNSDVGEYALRAKQEYERIMNDPESGLTKGQKKALEKWNSQNKVAVDQVIGLRQKKIAENVLLEMAKSEYFGRPLKTSQNETWKGNTNIGSYSEADRGKTIEAYAEAFGGKTEAAKAYDNAYTKLSATTQAMEHATALNGFKDAKTTMGC